MKRSTLAVLILVAVATMAIVAQASWLSKLVRGEQYVMNYPGYLVQATRHYDPSTSPKLLHEPYSKDVYVLRGDKIVWEITFLTGDAEGRPGQVSLSIPYGTQPDDEPSKDNDADEATKPRDHGGMVLLKTWPKDTKHISFVVDTALYPSGSYNLLLETFPRSKRQGHGEIAIPFYVAPAFREVKEALKDEPDETLRKYGLRRKVLVDRRSTVWTGDIGMSDNGTLTGVRLPRAPRVGEAIVLVDGYKVVGGGVIQSVNTGRVSIDMVSQVLRGYENRVSGLTAKLAFFSPVRGVKRALTAEEEEWVRTFPEYAGKDRRNRYRAAVRELLELGVIHVGEKLTSNHYWLGEQLATQPQGVWVPVDIPAEIAEEIHVSIDRAYGNGERAIELKDLVRLGISKPGLVSAGVIWLLNPIRNSNSQGQGQSQGQQQNQNQQQQQNQGQDQNTNVNIGLDP